MYKRHFVSALIIFIMLIILSIFVHPNYNDVFLSNSITFISIVFGFTITSLSILYSSDYAQNLYHQDDSEDSSISKLHRLANYYKTSINSSLFTVLFLLIQTLFDFNFDNIFIIPLMGLNVFIFYLIFNLFIKLFVQNKQKKDKND